jgi:hypothetical protein
MRALKKKKKLPNGEGIGKICYPTVIMMLRWGLLVLLPVAAVAGAPFARGPRFLGPALMRPMPSQWPGPMPMAGRDAAGMEAAQKHREMRLAQYLARVLGTGEEPHRIDIVSLMHSGSTLLRAILRANFVNVSIEEGLYSGWKHNAVQPACLNTSSGFMNFTVVLSLSRDPLVYFERMLGESYEYKCVLAPRSTNSFISSPGVWGGRFFRDPARPLPPNITRLSFWSGENHTHYELLASQVRENRASG